LGLIGSIFLSFRLDLSIDGIQRLEIDIYYLSNFDGLNEEQSKKLIGIKYYDKSID
jgi:hypothetical protein